MPLTFFHNCENNANIASPPNYSAGDTTGSLINSGTFVSGQGRSGGYSLRAPATFNGGLSFATPGGIWPGSLSTPTNGVGSMGFSVRCATSMPVAGVGTLCAMRFKGTAVNDVIGFSYAASGSPDEIGIIVRNGSGSVSVVTTGANMAAGNYYGVVGRFDIPNDLLTIEVYNAAGTLLDEATSTADLGAYCPADIDQFAVGQKQTTHAYDVDYDNFMVASEYDAPLQSYLAIEDYRDYMAGSQLILPYRSSGGMVDLSGNFRG